METCPNISLIKFKLSDYIRDILGHVSIQSTEIYARVDSKLKRESLEKASRDIFDKEIGKPSWEKDNELKNFLKNLV